MDDPNKKLSQLFDDGFNINEELNETSAASNSRQYQNKVKEGIKCLEEATNLVNELSLFSRNETIDELSTKNIKYLLLPGVLASLTLKSQQHERLEVIRIAHIYFYDFIQRLNDYQVCDVPINPSDAPDPDVIKSLSSSSLQDAARMRNDKIAKYKQSKMFDEKIKQLKEQISLAKDNNIDDEILRDFYITLLKRWVNTAFDELSSIEMEKPILEHMMQMKALGDDVNKDSKHSQNKKPLKPIIITKNEMQKKVFGLGYPSIPTVSVEQFVNTKIEEGTLAITDPIYDNSLLEWAQDPDKKRREDELQDEKKETLIEKDDPNELRKAREWDEWKDDHRRGEGNRKNMG